MSPTTGGKGPSENAEINEQSELIKSDKTQQQEKFIKEFVDEQKRDPNNGDEYASILDAIFLKGDSSLVTEKLQKYYLSSSTMTVGNNKKVVVGKFNVDDSIIAMIKAKTLGDFIKLKNHKQLLKNKFSKEFNFDLVNIDANLDKQINQLGFSGLNNLIKSKNNREEFINKILKNKTPEKRELLLLDGINIPSEIEKRMDLFNEQINKYGKNNLDLETLSEIKQLEEILQMSQELHVNKHKIPNFSGFMRGYIQGLYDLKILPKHEIDKFIEINTPHLTINEAKTKGILSESEILTLKKGYLQIAQNDKDLIKTFGTDLDVNINNIPDEIFGDFIIPTSYYTQGDYKIEEYFAKVGFNNFGDCLKQEMIAVEKQFALGEEKFKDIFNNKNIISDTSVSSREKFKEGNYFIWKRLDENTHETRTGYYKIKTIDFENDKIIIEDKGSHNKFNTNETGTQELTCNEYLELLKNIHNSNKKSLSNNITFITNDDRKKMIQEGSILEDKTTFEQKTDQVISDELQSLYEEHKSKLESENKTKDEIDEYFKNNDLYIQECKNIQNHNLEYTIDKINESDSDGREYGFDIGTSFITEGEDACVFTIKNIDINGVLPGEEYLGFIELVPENNGESQKVSFKDFYTTFIDKKCKRTSNAKNYSDLYNDIKSDIQSWNNFSLNDGRIQKNESENNYNYNYLVAKKGKEFIKGCDMLQVHEFQGDKVVISLGKLIQKDKKNTKSGKDETIYSMSSTTSTITIGALNTWIKQVELEPHHKEEANDIKEDEVDVVDRKGSFSSRLFARYSIGELIGSGKLWLDTFESYLKEGNEEHTAKLASGFLKGVLPKELEVAFQSRLEGATRKRMDDQVDMLKNLDSGPATEMIYQWLINKDTPEYKKEAGMIFMVKGYGTLYAKNALYKYKGKFLWYEAMGGKVNDERYKKMKKRAEEDDVPFTEESLLYDLIAYQCKDPNANIVRRGRLYKDLEGILGGGKSDELEKGSKDAGKKRNCKSRVDFAIGELEGGSYPNAMGAFEQIVNKGNGGDLTMLNKVPFVMLFSGISYSFDQDLIDKFKNNPGAGRLVISTMFISNVSKMDLFNKTVVQLSKDLLGNDAYIEAKKIFNKQRDSSSEVDKIKNATKFFDKYGAKLTTAMNFLNTGKTGENAEIENFILLKTRDENKNDDGYGIYKEYQDLFFGLTGAEGKFDVPDYMMDAHYKGGMSGLNMYKVASDVLKLNSSSAFAKGDVATMYWEEIQVGIETIGKRHFSDDVIKDRNDKEFLLTEKIRQLLAGILLNQGGNQHQFSGIMNGPTSVFGAKFNKWGIKAEDFVSNAITYDRMLEKDNVVVNNLLKKYVTNILDGNNHSMIKLTSDTVKAVETKLNKKGFDEDKIDEYGNPL